MELRHLEHFCAVADAQHFTRAAEVLGIAQSGLSASVRALERELGAELFVRTTRRVRLTEAGRALLTEAQRTLAAAAAAREAVTAVRGLLSGTLRVGTEQCMAAVEPVALLADFRTRHPGVEVHLMQAGSARLLEAVRTGDLDLAFVAGVAPPQGVTVRPLAEEPLMLLCRPGHPLADSGELEPRRLSGEVFVDLHPDWGARRTADAVFSAAGVQRTVSMQVSDVFTLLDLVARGLGVAVVPRPVIAKPQARALCAVPLTAAATWQVGVAESCTRRPSAAAHALLAMIQHQE